MRGYCFQGVLFLFMIIGGCGLGRETVKQETEAADALPLPAFKVVETDFKDISYNAGILLDAGGSENSVNATFRITKDSIMWISARKMGFEIGRLMLTEDSVWLLDRINNQYFAGDYLFFQNQFGIDVDYNLVQALFLGDPLSNWSEDDIETDCSDSRICVITYPQRYRVNQGRDQRARPEGSTVTSQRVTVSKGNGKMLSNEIEIWGSGRKISAEYGQFRPAGVSLLPGVTDIVINNQSEITKVSIIADSFKSDASNTYPFRIPGNYKPMTMN